MPEKNVKLYSLHSFLLPLILTFSKYSVSGLLYDRGEWYTTVYHPITDILNHIVQHRGAQGQIQTWKCAADAHILLLLTTWGMSTQTCYTAENMMATPTPPKEKKRKRKRKANGMFVCSMVIRTMDREYSRYSTKVPSLLLKCLCNLCIGCAICLVKNFELHTDLEGLVETMKFISR